MEEARRRTPSASRAFFLAVLSMLLTVAVAASLTFALFVKETKNNTVKIQAGDLEVGIIHTTQTGEYLDTNGKLQPLSQTPNKTLTDNAETDSKNIFTIENAVPSQEQTATFKITNSGKVAFKNYIEICDLRYDDTEITEIANASTFSKALAEQLKITIKVNGAQKAQFWLKDHAAYTGNTKVELGELLAGGVMDNVTVTVEFVDDTSDAGIAAGMTPYVTNNAARTGEVTFDVTFIAIQSTD